MTAKPCYAMGDYRYCAAARSVSWHGQIGRDTRAAMAQPIGLATIAHDPFAPEDAFGPHAESGRNAGGVAGGSRCRELARPLTPQTNKLIGAREFGLMKSGALLVNFGARRGHWTNRRWSQR